MRIVLDTNVLASALISPHGFSHELAERWEAGEFTLVTSAEQREELRRVLAYPRLQKRIDADQAARLLSNLGDAADVVGNLPAVRASSDEADNRIIAAALAGQATHLVTGDKSHLLSLGVVESVAVVSPRAMIEILNAAASS